MDKRGCYPGEGHEPILVSFLNMRSHLETHRAHRRLLRFMRKERSIMLSLMSQGLSSEQAINLLTHRTVGIAQSESGVLDGIFDASDRSEGGDLIYWWNDFEKDGRYVTCLSPSLVLSDHESLRYAKWGGDIRLLLRPMYPGQLPSLKLNLFNVVLAVDLSQTSSLNFIGTAISNIIDRQFPFRFGVVPIVETEGGQLSHWNRFDCCLS